LEKRNPGTIWTSIFVEKGGKRAFGKCNLVNLKFGKRGFLENKKLLVLDDFGMLLGSADDFLCG
jgi:hypothetical protein